MTLIERLRKETPDYCPAECADRLEQAEQLIDELESALKNTAEMDVKGYALIDRLQFSPKGRELMNQINEALASAKAWK